MLPRTGNDSIFLEYLDHATGKPMKAMIDEFPFIIGRNATCNLTVESGRVSREHAEVVRHGTGYLLRDLHSTNGVYVNGEPIEEHVLVDGDTVSIADFEFDFHCPSNETTRQTVTLAMDGRTPSSDKKEDPFQLIHALRTVNQWTGLSRIDAALAPIETLSDQQTIGYWCPLFRKAYQAHEEIKPLGDTVVLEKPLRMLQHVSAMFSVLERQLENGFLLLEVDQNDLQRVDLVETVGWMRTKFGAGVQVVLGGSVELWETNLAENALLDDIRAMGVQLAAVGIDQFKPPIAAEVFKQATYIGVSASALSGTSRSPAVANNIQEFITEVTAAGCKALAQTSPNSPDSHALMQMGFRAAVRFPS
ncbi:FHA domain-containing protein [Bremerella cremea]|nr:FHA domain-containing protein [Bremerella cremea]